MPSSEPATWLQTSMPIPMSRMHQNPIPKIQITPPTPLFSLELHQYPSHPDQFLLHRPESSNRAILPKSITRSSILPAPPPRTHTSSTPLPAYSHFHTSTPSSPSTLSSPSMQQDDELELYIDPDMQHCDFDALFDIFSMTQWIADPRPAPTEEEIDRIVSTAGGLEDEASGDMPLSRAGV